MTIEKLPGLNIQTPWARLLVDGQKTIETRTYPLPDKYKNRDMWVIETPGKSGAFKARVIGKIRFSDSKEYESAEEFYSDSTKHLIDKDDPNYAWSRETRKFGWMVDRVEKVDQFPPPLSKGIVYAKPFEMVGR